MLVCPSCKTQASDGAKFCRKCGAALVSEKAVTPEALARRESFRAGITADPQNAALLEEYGDYLLSVELVEDALVELHRASDLARSNEALLLKIAEAYRLIQQWDSAAAQFYRALKVSPENPVLHERIANVLLEGGRKEEAAQALSKQAEFTPDNLPILVRIRDLLIELSKHDDLVKVCRTILKKEPRDLKTWSILADALLSSNKGEEAVKAFQSILDINPDAPRANLYVGIAKHDSALSSNEAADAAAFLLNKAVAGRDALHAQERDMASLYLASAKLHSGSASLEIHSVLQDINLDNINQKQKELLARCFVLVGDLENEVGEVDDSIESYRESLRIQNSPLAQKRMAETYGMKGDESLRRGKLIRARDEFEQGLAYVPDDASLAAKRNEAVSRQKRKNLVKNLVGVAVFVIAGLGAAFLYYGQGAYSD